MASNSLSSVTISRISDVKDSHVPGAVQVLIEAFRHDPIRNIITGEDDELRKLMNTAIIQATIVGGQLYVAVNIAGTVIGTAAWFPPGYSFLSDDTQLQQGMSQFASRLAQVNPEAFSWYSHLLTKYKKLSQKAFGTPDDPDGTHFKVANWNLNAFAVLPAFQGKGIGRSLLAVGEDMAARSGHAVILETGDASLCPMYEHLRYTLVVDELVKGTSAESDFTHTYSRDSESGDGLRCMAEIKITPVMLISQGLLSIDVNLDSTYGPVLIGSFISCVFYGMTIVQTVIYFINYGKDPLYTQLVVIVNLLLSGVHVISWAASNYRTVIVHFGNLKAQLTVPWGTQSGALVSCLIILLVQSFFLWRIFLFSKQWSLVAFTALFVLATFGVGLTSPGTVVRTPTVSAIASLKGINLATDVLMAVTDALLAGILIYYLQSNRSNVKSTNAIISNLIRYAIGTGAFTAFLALLGMILRLAVPTSLANQCIYAIIPQSYANSLLATLNLRNVFKKPWSNNFNSVELSAFRVAEAMPDGSVPGGFSATQTLGGSEMRTMSSKKVQEGLA